MKTFTGIVTSTKMAKTIRVEVTRAWTHPMYQKTVKRTKKYLVHDEGKKAQVGDLVEFNECRPLSKLKRFKLISITGHALLDKPLKSEPNLDKAINNQAS
jgi:small subunit ribosomal protein S17